jgi:trehalose 6-phosphate phosphatase
MKNILSRECGAVLSQIAWSNVLLGFDFDGTLAPIVSQPDDAQMAPETRDLLVRVCGLYPCAVISGRARSDVMARLGRAAVKYIVGNHGLEPGGDLGACESEVAEARTLLAAALRELPGVELEDKRYSLAVHYRRSRNKRVARSAIIAAIGRLPVPMRIVRGKVVVNIVPARAPNKGDALLGLRQAELADTALYVGDDVTDEDVFELDQPGRLFGVRVGESRTSSAAYFIREQGDIDRLLAKLIAIRDKQSGK